MKDQAKRDPEMENRIKEHVRNHWCIADPDMLEYLGRCEATDSGIPTACGACGNLLFKDQPTESVWVKGPCYSFGLVVCEDCRRKLGNQCTDADLAMFRARSTK